MNELESLICQYEYKPAGDPWRRASVELLLSPSPAFGFQSQVIWPADVAARESEQFEKAIEKACYELLIEETVSPLRAVILLRAVYDPEGTSQRACYVAARRALETSFGLPLTSWSRP